MTALWYAGRATGLASLVLLTAVVLLGVAGAARLRSPRWPRFALAATHRNLSLLAATFLAVHVATAIIDPYAGIGWLSAVLPFDASYHPFWLGLGAVAFDLFIALIVSSLLRPRIRHRTWRALHWTAYLCWPVAIVHGLGIGGADARLTWVIALVVGCALAGLTATGWRATVRHADTEARQHPFPRTRT